VNVAIIPARGGSKRIPRKNIRDFCGTPMIAWSIAAARESGCFERIVVSTDDAEIAEVARMHGAEVPFLRPVELSDDYTGTVAVIQHAVQQLSPSPKFACCIYPTAPFIRAKDIAQAHEVLKAAGCAYVFTVSRFAAPIQRALRITKAGRVMMFQPAHLNTRSQDLEAAYHDAAQFYWGRADAWLSGDAVFEAESIPVILPRHRVQDIDDEEDWKRAELMFASIKAEEQESR
jgi:pseudaminic acid cytidylyltransferase